MSAKMTAAAKRYAKALVELSKNDGSSANVEAVLAEFSRAIESSKELYKLLNDPTFTSSERAGILKTLLEQLNAPKALSNFVQLLCQKGRTNLLVEISKQFKKVSLEEQGLKEAVLETAQELSAAEQDAIKNKIEKTLKQKVVLKTIVKPSLVAGLRVHVGGETWDATLNAQFDQLKSQLGNV